MAEAAVNQTLCTLRRMPDEAFRRLGSVPEEILARWLLLRENPLTSRVTVNRIWQEYLGQGLVETSADFGCQGDRPTHPELLALSNRVDSSWLPIWTRLCPAPSPNPRTF